MSKPPPLRSKLSDRASRHVQLMLTGLAVVLVPAIIVTNAVEHAHKAVAGVLTKLSPKIQVLGGVGVALVVLLLILLACWLLGWLVSRTRVGKRLIEWEKATFLGKAPKLEKKLETRKKAGEPKPKAPQPALAHVGGGWQPGVIVDEESDGWASVFLPDLPSTTAGRLYLLPQEQVRRLDVSLDDFQKRLTALGRETKDWLKTLSGDAS